MHRQLIYSQHNQRRFLTWAGWTWVLVAIDQVSKTIVRMNLSPGERIPLLEGFCYITFLPNERGYAWFVPELPDWIGPAFFMLRVLILIMAYPVYAFSMQSGHGTRWAWLALVGIFAGILGNMIDDLFVPYTTDFLQVGNSPAANCADLWVYAGIISLVVEIILRAKGKKPEWQGIRYHWADLIEKRRAFIRFLRQSLRK